jgi:phosphoribosylformylglycinamidine synthase
MSEGMAERLWNIDVEIMPKAGVNDPAGEAILGGLGMLGFGEVHRVRSGKLIRLQVGAADESTAAARAVEMAGTLLANPVIEVFEVRVAGPVVEAASR